MFKKLGNMANIMKQAQQMQSNMSKAQKIVEETEITESQNDLVFVTIKGDGTVKIKLDESLKNEDIEMMEDIISIAVQKANKSFEDKKLEIMNEAVPESLRGMSLPL